MYLIAKIFQVFRKILGKFNIFMLNKGHDKIQKYFNTKLPGIFFNK